MPKIVIELTHVQIVSNFQEAFDIWREHENSAEVGEAIDEVCMLFFDDQFCFYQTYLQLMNGLGFGYTSESPNEIKLLRAAFYIEISAIFCQFFQQMGISEEAQQRFRNVVARVFEGYTKKTCEPLECRGRSPWGHSYITRRHFAYYDRNQYTYPATTQEQSFVSAQA